MSIDVRASVHRLPIERKAVTHIKQLLDISSPLPSLHRYRSRVQAALLILEGVERENGTFLVVQHIQIIRLALQRILLIREAQQQVGGNRSSVLAKTVSKIIQLGATIQALKQLLQPIDNLQEQESKLYLQNLLSSRNCHER